MDFVLFAAVGVLMNRVRGGWLELPSRRLLNDLAFATFVYLHTGELLMAAVALPSMMVGRSFGWGRYIGALGGWEDKKLEELPPVDFLIRGLCGRPKLWGFAGLSLRGMIWGLCLHFALGTLWPILAGLSMGLCYWLAIQACRRLKTSHPNGDGWEWGEIIFGGVLWASCTI